jgi:hypothetical protein
MRSRSRRWWRSCSTSTSRDWRRAHERSGP